MTDDYTEVIGEGFSAHILDNTATDSLPIYYFSENGISAPHDGLIVLFEIKEKQSWIGKFEASRNGVHQHLKKVFSNGSDIFVWNGGALYEVNPKNPIEVKNRLYSDWCTLEFIYGSLEANTLVFYKNLESIQKFNRLGELLWETQVGRTDGFESCTRLNESEISIRLCIYYSEIYEYSDFILNLRDGHENSREGVKYRPLPEIIVTNQIKQKPWWRVW